MFENCVISYSDAAMLSYMLARLASAEALTVGEQLMLNRLGENLASAMLVANEVCVHSA